MYKSILNDFRKKKSKSAAKCAARLPQTLVRKSAARLPQPLVGRVQPRLQQLVFPAYPVNEELAVFCSCKYSCKYPPCGLECNSSE